MSRETRKGGHERGYVLVPRDDETDEQPAPTRGAIVARCGLCPGNPVLFDGPAGEAIRVQAEHRRLFHPEAKDRGRFAREKARQEAPREFATRGDTDFRPIGDR